LPQQRWIVSVVVAVGLLLVASSAEFDRRANSSAFVASDNATGGCYHLPRVASKRSHDQPRPQIYCPYCQSSKIQIFQTTTLLTVCRCLQCDADFTVFHPSAT
jgi:hypothetical protein